MKRSSNRGAAKLVAITAVVIIVWGVLLPRLSQTETVRRRHQWLDDRGIDPAAMFYTDLPMLDRSAQSDRPVRSLVVLGRSPAGE